MSNPTTIRERIHDALHSAGPAGLTMAGLSGAVTGPWRSRDVEDLVRKLWQSNELGRRGDGTFVLTAHSRVKNEVPDTIRRSRASLDAAVRRVAAGSRRDGHSTRLVTRTVDPALLKAFCPGCRTTVHPLLDGSCPTCGIQTGANLEAPAKRRRRPRRKPLEKGHPAWGPVCKCGAPKAKQAHSCRACTTKRRRGRKVNLPTADRRRRPTAISEELLLEARRLYAAGLSLRQVAAQIHPQTSYKTVQSCAEGLYSLFKTRGWKLRPQAEVTRARNFKHGRKARGISSTADVAYRHWLKTQRGWKRVSGPGQPTCKGFKQQAPGKGKPCDRPAMEGKEYCYSHDPSRELERQAICARMRSKQTYREPVLPAEPYAAWLMALRAELGSWAQVADLIGAHVSAAKRWGEGKTSRVAVRVVERSAENAGTTIEHIYGPNGSVTTSEAIAA